MEIVISIVSWNTADLLRRCLLSLRQHVNPANARVVVIDNASRDGTPAMVRAEFPEVTLVESGGNLGFGRAHNLIAQIGAEPFVLFLNPDAEFPENAHEKMVQFMKAHPDIGLMGCRMVDLDGTTQHLGFQWRSTPWTELTTNLLAAVAPVSVMRRFLPWHDPNRDGYVRKLYGGCLLARRDVLNEVGWFDDRFFMYGEDVDLSRRVEASGRRLYYLASTRVIHVCGGASAKAPGRFSTLMQCESISKLMAKYYHGWGALIHRLAIMARALVVVLAVAIPFGVTRWRNSPVRSRWENPWRKHWAMLKWSLGLERAEIPR